MEPQLQQAAGSLSIALRYVQQVLAFRGKGKQYTGRPEPDLYLRANGNVRRGIEGAELDEGLCYRIMQKAFLLQLARLGGSHTLTMKYRPNNNFKTI